MSTPQTPPPALLFMSIFSGCWDAFWPRLKPELAALYGPLAYCSEPFAFDHTAYYTKEFGQSLTRRVLGFARLLEQDRLAEAKLAANQLEQAYGQTAAGGVFHRIFNIDPGLLSLERLVLATGKNYTHRVYLGSTVWADVTLIYQKGGNRLEDGSRQKAGWMALPWTFPDYAGAEMQTHLLAMRELYKQNVAPLIKAAKECACSKA